MRNFLSRYGWNYPRTLVYMLQASEYDIREYAAWFRRTKDFSNVARRRQLDLTLKARLLLVAARIIAAAWIIITLLCVLVLAVSVALQSAYHDVPTAWFVAVGAALLLAIVAAPFVLAYGLTVPLLVGQLLIQRPKERAIMRRTHDKLERQTAVRIAIAGSYGKTTFKTTLETIIATGKKVAATPGNLNTPLGIARFVDDLKGDEEVLIFEFGEYYPGDIKKLAQMVNPHLGVITGINEAHLSKFKTLERTADTIFELADFLGPKLVWANGENEAIAARITQSDRLYGRHGVEHWKVERATTDLNGVHFTAKSGNKKIHAKSKLLGLHQVGPLVAAIDMATELGLTSEQIEAGIAATKPFEHRLEPREENGVVMIDDTYNGNPDGVRAALEFFDSLEAKRKIYVTPGLVEMGPRAREVHIEIGRDLADTVDVVMLVKNSVTPFIEEGLKAAEFKGELIWYPDGISSLVALPKLTKAGDVVLLQNDWPDNFA